MGLLLAAIRYFKSGEKASELTWARLDPLLRSCSMRASYQLKTRIIVPYSLTQAPIIPVLSTPINDISVS